MLWETDADEAGLSFGGAWHRVTGLAADAPLGSAWQDLVHPDDRETLLAGAGLGERPFRVRDRAGEWRRFIGVAEIRRDDGGASRSALAAVAVPGPRAPAAVPDVSPLAIGASVGCGTYDWDLHTGRVLLSPEPVDLYGIDPGSPAEEVHAIWLDRVHPDERTRVQQETRRFAGEGAAGEGDTTASDFRVVMPDGSTPASRTTSRSSPACCGSSSVWKAAAIRRTSSARPLAGFGGAIRVEIGHDGSAPRAGQRCRLGLQLDGLCRQTVARRSLDGAAVQVASLPLKRG